MRRGKYLKRRLPFAGTVVCVWGKVKVVISADGLTGVASDHVPLDRVERDNRKDQDEPGGDP